MPTVTRPKRISDPYMVPVKIRRPERKLINECVGTDSPENPKAFRTFIRALEKLLTFHFNKMRRSRQAPLPAHSTAALVPIERRASELAELLNPHNLPLAVLRELGVEEVSDGQAWHLLTKIQVSAGIATDRLKQQKSSGMHLSRFDEQHRLALDQLSDHFSAYRPIESDDDPKEYEAAKKEFLSTCKKYLPRSPRAGKARAKNIGKKRSS